VPLFLPRFLRFFTLDDASSAFVPSRVSCLPVFLYGLVLLSFSPRSPMSPVVFVFGFFCAILRENVRCPAFEIVTWSGCPELSSPFFSAYSRPPKKFESYPLFAFTPFFDHVSDILSKES